MFVFGVFLFEPAHDLGPISADEQMIALNFTKEHFAGLGQVYIESFDIVLSHMSIIGVVL